MFIRSECEGETVTALVLNALVGALLYPSESRARSACENLLFDHDVTIVIPSPITKKNGDGRKLWAEEKRKLEEIYGARLVIDEASPSHHIDGLVIHLFELGYGSKKYPGAKNLFSGKSKLYRELLDNKWAEYPFAEKVQPGVMPETRQASTVLKDYSRLNEYRSNLKLLKESLNRFITSGHEKINDITRAKVELALKLFLESVEQAFPTGAFVKYIREAQTGDSGQLIHTPKADPRELAATFISEIERIKSELYRRPSKFDRPQIHEYMEDSKYSAVHLMKSLLFEPNDVIVQQKLQLQKTKDGTLAEVRVDFTSFGPVNATLRWGYDVAIGYNRRAMDFFREFWDKAPPEFRELSGGADVVFLEDGSMKIIEFNIGGQSGFMDASTLIIPGNLFISKILGRPTLVIEKLEEVVEAGVERQIVYLSTTKPLVKPEEVKHLSMDDMYLPDAFQYIRDRLLENWNKYPSADSARLLEVQFRWLAQSQLKRIEDAKTRELIKDMARFGAEYMQEVLSATSASRSRLKWPSAG